MGFPNLRILLWSSILLTFRCHPFSLAEGHVFPLLRFDSRTGYQPDSYSKAGDLGAQDYLASNGIKLAGGGGSRKPGETEAEARTPQRGVEARGQEIEKEAGAGPETKNLHKISWISGGKNDKLACKKLVRILITILTDNQGKLVISWAEICENDGGKFGGSKGSFRGNFNEMGDLAGNGERRMEGKGLILSGGNFGGNDWDFGGNHGYPQFTDGVFGGSQGNVGGIRRNGGAGNSRVNFEEYKGNGGKLGAIGGNLERTKRDLGGLDGNVQWTWKNLGEKERDGGGHRENFEWVKGGFGGSQGDFGGNGRNGGAGDTIGVIGKVFERTRESETKRSAGDGFGGSQGDFGSNGRDGGAGDTFGVTAKVSGRTRETLAETKRSTGDGFGGKGGNQKKGDDGGKMEGRIELCSAPQPKYTLDSENMIKSLPKVFARIIWQTALKYGKDCTSIFYRYGNLDEIMPINIDDKFGGKTNIPLDNRKIWPIM